MTDGAVQTLILPTGPESSPADLEETRRQAVDILAAGGLVAMPTDTVYGIAVRADRPDSVERLYRLKKRPRDRSMTVHLGAADEATLARHCEELPPVARRLAARFWPGGLTLVVPGTTASGIAESGELVGLRVVDHALVQAILSSTPAPVVMPSANRSGAPPALSFDEVREGFAGRVDAILDGGRLPERKSSTVVLARPDSWEVLRAGAIPADAIRDAALVQLVLCCTGNTCRSPMAEAILRHRLERALAADDLEQLGIHLTSAGVRALPGSPASEGAVRAVERRGLSLVDHRSRPLDEPLALAATMIYGLTSSHREAVAGWLPEVPVTLLDPDDENILDPIGGDDDVYERVCVDIERAIDARLPEILELAGLSR